MLISPSILSADFGKLNEEIASVDNYCDLIHIDVMDGNFVNNITIGAPVVKCIKSKKPLDCHLMIMNPEKYIEEFIKIGVYQIGTHIELGEESVLKCLKICKKNGVKYGIVINPETNINKLDNFFDKVDYILVMSVKPGFGGQTFDETVLEKVKYIKSKNPKILVEMDGGITDNNIDKIKKSGVDIVVVGSFIFKSENREKAIKLLK